ncbi:MAG: DUF1850 domain-containing protein [Candidatus Atribacteria bacterium]|nr:DUF1850 domain-containing protein [Candidatus Atribacteria bacterium]
MIGKKHCQYKFFYINIFISLFFIALFVAPIIHVLEVKDIQKNEILFQEKIFPGYVFATKIRHSVQLSPVFEFYEIDHSYDIILTKTIIKDLGWGMPSSPEGKLQIQNGVIIIDDIHRKIPVLRFRVSYIAEPEFILRGRTYDLRFLVDDSHSLEILSKKISALSRIYYFFAKE